MSRQNYYLLLELDPSARDAASIENAIKKKQVQWSRERNIPGKSALALQNMEELKNIRKVLLESGAQARNDEADAAKNEICKELRNKAFISVDDNGEISKRDLGKFAEEFKLAESEILKILNAKVKKEAVMSYKDDGIEPLNKIEREKIRASLSVVKKEDLFDFLGLSQNSSYGELLKKANEIDRATSLNSNKTSAEGTATLDLARLCKTLFKDNDSKRKYEKTLHISLLDDVYPLMDHAADDGIIEPHEYRKLIEACARKGIKADEAEYRIYEYCNEMKNVPIIQKPESSAPSPSNAEAAKKAAAAKAAAEAATKRAAEARANAEAASRRAAEARKAERERDGNAERKVYSDGVYEGAFVGGKKHGRGKYSWKDGDVYDGDWVNDRRTGKGKFTFGDGDTYIGDFVDGNFQGRGKYTFKSSGRVKEGIWSNNEFVRPDNESGSNSSSSTRGRQEYSNGVYEGDLVGNKRHGKGKYTWKDGDVYEGEWRNDELTGKGKYTWSDGEMYIGDYVNWKRHGRGKNIYPSGNVYEGDWVNEKRTGKGKYTFKNGDTYVGDFVDGNRQGRGKYTWANGDVREGIWNNDEFVR